ncbi:MAG: hypothetical protein C0505_13730 [Leptothrix sp. (in: Bacteria)]|nr:hypothetical protein [Leptothrix sp. (in: b-proteobacteria)]
MTVTRRHLLTVSLAAPGWLRAQAAAVVVEGQAFDRRVAVAGRELLLNGVGVRAVAWFKGYAAGLYLAERSSTAAQAVDLAGPKRLQIRLLVEVPAAEFVKALRKGMQRNTSPAGVAELQQRMATFEALIAAVGVVRKGAVVDLDFDPARGTAFSLDGKLQGEVIPGEDFYAALLRSFVGERPYDRALRAGLLGQRE